MPRKPEPWYWEARKGWYVQINRKQEKLGADPEPARDREGNARPPTGVMREYHRLMCSSSLVGDAERRRATVPQVCEAFLGVKSSCAPEHVRIYGFYLKRLSGPHMKRRFDALRAADVERIAAAQKTWSEGTRHNFIGRVMTLFRWAKDAGFTEFNALAGYENPYEEGKRERGLTDAEFRAILDRAKDVEFKRILMFMRGTGCRPGEARRITAADLDPERPLIVLKKHKTVKKTRKPKLIFMPDEVAVMVRLLAQKYPTGPLFRNSRNGQGWSEDAIPKRFRCYRKALGLGDEVVPYMIRHATLSRLLNGGTSSHHTASIAGHKDTKVLLSTYFHAEDAILVEALNRAAKFEPRDPGAGTK